MRAVSGLGRGNCQNDFPTEPGASISMCSARNFTRRPFQCGLYEAQDVLCDTGHVDLICLQPKASFRWRERHHRRLVFHDFSDTLVFFNPGLCKFRLTRDYDLFIAVCQNYWDLLYLNAIEGWQDRCKASICWLDEMWVATLSEYRHWLPALKRFDHIFVGCGGTVTSLSQVLGRPCSWLPGGVDALRFSPYPSPSQRVVDVYSIGRRSAGIHDSLLRAARNKELFYIYDSLPVTDTEVYDYRQHREMLANIAKRSRYFMVAPGKVDDPQTRGQIEIGYRYYEGAMAGSVLIGERPTCEAFDEMFPWPDVIIPIKSDGSDVLQVLADLNGEPSRVSFIARRNAAQSLLRHDWIYRWEQMFNIAGIPLSSGMLARKEYLKNLAALAERNMSN